jgi:hypothetical protein
MTHTYRDSTILDSKTLQFVLFPLVVFLVIAALAVSTLAGGFTWAERGEGVVGFGLFFGLGYVNYRRHRYGTCGEIRLSDDGTCELETKRRVVSLHVNEIRSVTYSTSDEGESYEIHYHGGSLPARQGMAGFPDFLARLKTLNPAVDLTSFPAAAWPGLGAPATGRRGTSVGRSIRGALFSAVIVAALIWLAIETLTRAK